MKNPNISDPYDSEYDADTRDIIMDLAPFYDPNHRCNIVREDVFKKCLEELRQREKKALEQYACKNTKN